MQDVHIAEPNIKNKTHRLRFATLIRNQEGFSLIEAMIALAILTVGILGMTGLTSTIVDHNARSEKVTIATTLAQDKIEYFRNKARGWLLSGGDGLDSPDVSGGIWSSNPGGETVDAEGNPTAGGTYTRTWTISPVPTENFLYEIVMNISWQDEGTQTFQLSTRITQ